MNLGNTVRDLENEELLIFQTHSFVGSKNNPVKIVSTSRFANFKFLKDNWVNAKNKDLRMHMFLKL